MLVQLIEQGKNEEISGAVDTIIQQGLAQMEQAAILGRALIPSNREAQLLLISYSYFEAAMQNPEQNKKIWQYIFSLAASKQANAPDCNHQCWNKMIEDFPDLPKPVFEYLKINYKA